MGQIQNLKESILFIIKQLFLAFFMLLGLTLLYAGETHHLDVSVPAQILAGDEILIKVAAMDETNEIVAADARTLELMIYNGSEMMMEKVALKAGKAELKLTLPNFGATLLQTYDPENPQLVSYQAFDVLQKIGAQK